MRPHGHPLPPTSSLPPLRCSTPDDLTEERIDLALHNLREIYCPLPRAVAFSKPSLAPSQGESLTVPLSPIGNANSGATTPLPVDSGYASGDDDENDEYKANLREVHDAGLIATLSVDQYERQFAIRWLTTFLARADELLEHIDEDIRDRLIDDASYILASFSNASDAEEDEDAGAIVREFSFELAGPAQQEEEAVAQKIEVRLTDGTPATGTDHTDVGLQSWGASIVISDIMCSSPEQFGLTAAALGAAPRIIELGAGTGLVGITMAKLLPRIGVTDAEIIATDYHPAVLANLRDNVIANFPTCGSSPPVKTCLLDWSAPCLDAPLHMPADMLVATDVVYAPEHAIWLRDCAAKLLAPHGAFWLIASVRPNGRFEGVTDTVEDAFADVRACPRSEDGRTVLRILGRDRHEKRKGIGREDEIGYKVFRIGWEAIEKAGL